jgi:hypothetical protein
MITGTCFPGFLLLELFITCFPGFLLLELLITVCTCTAVTPWRNFNKTLKESFVNISQVFSRVSTNTMKECVCVAGQGKGSSNIVNEVTDSRN